MRQTIIFIGEIAAVIAVLVSAITWGIRTHNQYLMDAISPLLRTAYVTRINNYRRIQCEDGQLTVQQQIAFDEVMSQYEGLVGRPIGDRECP